MFITQKLAKTFSIWLNKPITTLKEKVVAIQRPDRISVTGISLLYKAVIWMILWQMSSYKFNFALNTLFYYFPRVPLYKQ